MVEAAVGAAIEEVVIGEAVIEEGEAVIREEEIEEAGEEIEEVAEEETADDDPITAVNR